MLQTWRGVVITAIWQREQISQAGFTTKQCRCFILVNSNGTAIFAG